MRLYENVFIVRQELSPAQVQTLSESYDKLIAEQGGEVAKSEYCGLRQLAYPIQKNASGHYVLMNIKGTNAAISELERKMRLNEDVIRFLTIAVDEHDNSPSVLLQQTRQREAYSPNDRSSSRRPSSPRDSSPRSEDKKTDKPTEASSTSEPADKGDK